MSSPRPRNDPSSASPPDRPPIWVNGRQRPSFDVKAYGAYSLIATRAALGPALTRASDATQGLQARLLAGAFPINTERLGKVAAYLPTRSGIATTVEGIAVALKDAAEVVQPAPPPVESLAAYDALWRARKVPASGRLRGVDLDAAQSDPDLRALRNDAPLRPTRPVRPVLVHSAPPVSPLVVAESAAITSPPAAPVAPTAPQTTAEPEQDPLLAIRSMLSDPVPDPEPIAPSAPPQLVTAATPQPAGAGVPHAPRIRKPLPAWTRPIFRAARRACAFAIGWGLTVVAMPIGLTKAAIAHFEGRDLRDLVEDP
jgi:hypothetical protein